MDSRETIRILFVDDDKEDYFITRELLSGNKNRIYKINWIAGYNEAVAEVEKTAYDLFIFDYNLGLRTGIDLIDTISAKCKNVPVIMLTGQSNPDIDELALKKGVSDYLVKGKFDGEILERSIRYAIEKKDTEKKMMYLAYYDQLTDLPNRVFFMEQLNYALAHAVRYNRKLAVLFLDLDNFKMINDSLGHHAGDCLLRHVAGLLHQSIRKVDILARNNLKTQIDTVARMGGDEFTISLTEINSYEDASIVATRIIESLSAPVLIEGNTLYIGVSIGIAMYPDDSDNAETLLKYADNAMYHAKKNGKNNFQYYRKEMNSEIMKSIRLTTGIRKAAESGQFFLEFQPKIDLRSERIIGFESLIRWKNDDNGILPPLDFIPYAEKHHLISCITDWVIKEVCRLMASWKEKASLLPVSINLPVTELMQARFTDKTAGMFRSCRIPAQFIEFEVTESVFTDNPERMKDQISALKAAGFMLSIDDFGTGYSSLSRLKNMDCDILKIDKCFIDNIPSSVSDTVIINSVIAMGHGLGMKILAEGVENRDQYDYLRNNDCDYMQGYYFCKPVPADLVPGILQKINRRNTDAFAVIRSIITDG